MKNLLRRTATALAIAATVAASAHVTDGYVKADRSQLRVSENASRAAMKQMVVSRPTADDGTATPTAYYKRPAGALFNGFSKNLGLLQNYVMLAPAYADATWLNTSTNFTSGSWSFDGETSTEIDLVTNLPYSWHSMPTLNVADDNGGSDSYTFPDAQNVQFGGTLSYNDGTTDVSAGLGNWRINKKYTSWGFGRDPYADWTWTSLFGSYYNETWVVQKVGNYFEKPVRPYFFTEMWVNCVTDCSDDTEFIMELFSVDDEGKLAAEPFAIGRCAGSDVLTFDVSGGMTEDTSYEIIPFSFSKIVDGEEVPVSHLVIDGAMMAFISGFDDPAKVPYYDTFSQYEPNDDGECNSYLIFDITTATGGKDSYFMPTSYISNGKPLNLSNCFNMDATFPWLVGGDDAFEAPVQGGSTAMQLNSYFDAAKLTVEADEWIDVEITDGTTENTVNLVVTAGQLPEGATSRQGEVRITAPAVEKTIAVTQGERGIKGVSASCTAKVAMSNGDIAVTLPTADEVTILDAAGRIVSRATLTEGRNVLPASHLAGGLYLLRFATHGTTKIVK